MIGYAKKIEKIIRESAFDKKKKKPRLKFNPGLALIRVRRTGPRGLMHDMIRKAEHRIIFILKPINIPKTL